MKKLIAGAWRGDTLNQDEFAKALLLFRNTPRSGGKSPAEIVFGRPARDSLPAHHRSFAPEWQRQDRVLERRVRYARDKRAKQFNATAHSLRPLQVGDHVLVQNPVTKHWVTPGVIAECGPNRDYIIRTPAGRLCRRNRRFLRRRIPVMPEAAPASSTTTSPSYTQAAAAETAAETRRPGRRARRKQPPDQPPRRSSRTKRQVVPFQARH